jgi:hypothetical protein
MRTTLVGTLGTWGTSSLSVTSVCAGKPNKHSVRNPRGELQTERLIARFQFASFDQEFVLW